MMEIKEFKLDQKGKVLELFKLAFGKNMDFDFWDWRYLNNPYTKNNLINLMWQDDELIGHYALWPMEFRFRDEILKGALSMTTMTHPNYGGKGIFTNLANSIYDRAFKEDDIQIIWGFPNKNSHYGFISKLDWKDVAVIPMLSKILDVHSSNELVDIKKNTVFDDSHAESLCKNTPKGALVVNKTAKYLNWRYMENPKHEYHFLSNDNLDGFLVFKIIPSLLDRGKKEVDILEWNVPADLAQCQLAFKLIQSFVNKFKLDCSIKLNVWISIHDPRFILLEKLGFRTREPLTFLGKLERWKTNRFDHFVDWSLTMGDSDVF